MRHSKSPFDLHRIGPGVVVWFGVFGLVQQGLRQTREEQLDLSRAHALKAEFGLNLSQVML
jgi:hypothetical protein